MKIQIVSKAKEFKGFQYFWGKEVNGFDDTKHCFQCLKGKSYPNIFQPKNMPVNKEVELPLKDGQVLYICGVSKPYSYHSQIGFTWAIMENPSERDYAHIGLHNFLRTTNLHLPVIEKKGASARKTLYTGDEIIIIDAEELFFDDKVAKEKYAHLGHEYTACRNFQFAAWLTEKRQEGAFAEKAVQQDLF